MQALGFTILAGLALRSGGCSDQAKATGKDKSPAFLFWCFRKEVVSEVFHVPEMTTAAAATYIQGKLRGIPGFVRSSCDLQARTLTVDYQSSAIRKMNFEEAIALAGFSVNGRPANPKAKIPAGVK